MSGMLTVEEWQEAMNDILVGVSEGATSGDSEAGEVASRKVIAHDASQRAEIFSLLEQAIDNLESSLNTNFSATTQVQL